MKRCLKGMNVRVFETCICNSNPFKWFKVRVICYRLSRKRTLDKVAYLRPDKQVYLITAPIEFSTDQPPSYLLCLCLTLNMKNAIAIRIPIAEHEVIVAYSQVGTESSSYRTYVLSRGIFPPVYEIDHNKVVFMRRLQMNLPKPIWSDHAEFAL